MSPSAKRTHERRLKALESGECSKKREGKKKNFGQAAKLERAQRNWTDKESGKGRQSWNYHPEIKQAFIS